MLDSEHYHCVETSFAEKMAEYFGPLGVQGAKFFNGLSLESGQDMINWYLGNMHAGCTNYDSFIVALGLEFSTQKEIQEFFEDHPASNSFIKWLFGEFYID